MGITNSNKTLSAGVINCGGTFQVRLSLAAEPGIITSPTDIVLLLNRSASMSGAPLLNLKNGVNRLIDVVDEATDATEDGTLGAGNRMAIISFADTATQNTAFTTSVAELKAAVDGLTAGGLTNHADAFNQALALFESTSTNAKVMVIISDGMTTAGGDPDAIAESIKASGVTVYSIGLPGAGGLNEQALNDWSSDPDTAYTVLIPEGGELADIFDDLGDNATINGATNISITDTIDECFRITSLSSPSKGTATLVNQNTVTWTMTELGTTAAEGATLEFTVEHIGPCTGTVEVNDSITYTDTEGNGVAFPSPTIDVDCGVVITPEPCPTPVDITVDGCEDTVEFDAGSISMSTMGRIVQLEVTLQNVCPGKRVALAVLLSETDADGTEYNRGMKMLTVPAHTQIGCRDVVVRCINFVLPEDLNVSEQTEGVCNTRNLRARFISHYIDSEFECCGDTPTPTP